jgi:hypothetical protein
MGFFSKLFGGGDKVAPPFSPTASPEQRSAAAKQLLEQVAALLQLGSAVVATREDDAELRGTLRGFPLRLVVDSRGSIDDADLRYEGDLEYIDLDYDPELERAAPQPDVEPWDKSDKRIFIGPGVFSSGSSCAKEVAEFRKLEPALQQRTIDEMRRLRIRYFRSRREEHNLHFYDDLEDVAEPAKWLADAFALAADVAQARGAVPPGTPRPSKHDRAYASALELARQIAARIPSARVVERKNDARIDVRWSECETPVRLVVDDSLDASVSARVDSEASFELYYNPEVVIEAEPEQTDEWDDVARKIFFGRSVYLDESRSVVAKQAAILRALPPAALTELVEAMLAHEIEDVSLGDGVLELEVDASDDGGVLAITLAGMLARVATALPRGAAPGAGAEHPTRCAYCNALWFAGPSRTTCPNCGANA